MRFVMMALALCLVDPAQAADQVHRRGDFQFETGSEPGHVIVRELPGQWEPAAPGASGATWRVWLFDKQVDRRDDRAAFYIDYAYEAKSPSLLSDAGKYQIKFNPGYQRLVIHRVQLRRDGTWQDRLDPEQVSLARRERGFEQDMSDGEVTALILLDDVRVDDVVRIAYTVHGSNPILAGQDSDTTYFGWQPPVLDVGLRMLDDPGVRLDVRVENGAPAPARRESAEGVEVELRAHAVAGVVDESSYPVWYQPFPRAQVSVERSWADVVAWALPLYPQVDGPLPADLEARIEEWSKIPSQRGRLTAALRAIQDEIRYFGVEMGENTHRPVAPSQTWTRRRGDCKDKAYLLSTILDRLGIPSVPALTSTQEGKAVGAMIPSAYVFNHVIVRSTVDGKPVWVDPTISQQGGDAVGNDLSLYGVVLPIASGVDALEAVRAPAMVDAGAEVLEIYRPTVDGRDVPLEIRTTYKGKTADARRAGFASERLADISRRYADYYRKRFGQLSAQGEPVVSDDRDANVLTVVERYRLESPFENESASLRGLSVRADVIEGPSALPSTMHRTGPLHFAPPGKYRHEMRVVIPEGWKPTFGSETVSIDDANFDYSRNVRISDGMATLTYDMEVSKEDIPPAQVSSHLGELRKVRDSLGATFRFRMPQPQDDEDRARRLRELLRKVQEGGRTP